MGNGEWGQGKGERLEDTSFPIPCPQSILVSFSSQCNPQCNCPIPSTQSSVPNPQSLNMETKWLEWAQKLQAIAQNGLTYSEGAF